MLDSTPKSYCVVRKIQYDTEPARIVTDGLCHPGYPQHLDSVTVLDSIGNIVSIYDSIHPNGIEWNDYLKEYNYFMFHKVK